MHELRYSKYLLALVVTAGIVLVSALLSNTFYSKRLEEIQSLEDRIALNQLASEVQYDLLSQLPCDAEAQPAVSEELGALADRLGYLEQTRGSDDQEFILLKQRYSLFEIKDYLIVRELSRRCGAKLHAVLYFYAIDNCADCKKQGYVLSELRTRSPELRVYSLDYNFTLGAINTLKKLYKMDGTLPALVIDGKLSYGFKSLEEFEQLFPELATSTSVGQ